MARIDKFDRHTRSSRPWLYRKTPILALTYNQIIKFGIPLVLIVLVLIAPIWKGLADVGISVPINAITTISIVDGDTIRSNGRTYRLVGFDAPEAGARARCERERALAAAATKRLRQLVSGSEISLQRVPCACRPGTEGSPSCNYGRLCGVLKISNRDVGAILVSEGLARSYICSGTHCPRRKSWCD
jgi:endonuclease YncB( thermonuclease family)